MNLQSACAVNMRKRMSRCIGLNRKLNRINAIIVASFLSILGSAAHAATNTTDPLDSFASRATPDSPQDATVANLNTDADRPTPRHYSNNAATNATLNAVFQIIQSQGNGLVWNGEADATADSAPTTPSAVVDTPRSGPPTDPAAAITTAKLIAHQGTVPPMQSAFVPTSLPTATPAGAAIAANASQVAPAVPTWAVKPNATLQETLTEWARTEGWSDPKWLAQNPYRIESAPIQGSFIDALGVVANAVPQLDINVSTARHELTITDHQMQQ